MRQQAETGPVPNPIPTPSQGLEDVYKRHLTAPGNAVTSNLAAAVRLKFERAKQAKNLVQRQIINAKRARAGIYPPEKVVAMQDLYGKEYDPIYLRVIDTKCLAGEALLKDILIRSDDKPWDLEPTAEPEIPKDAKDKIEESVYNQVVQNAVIDAYLTGQEMTPETAQGIIERAMPIVIEKAKREILLLAKQAAERMATRIEDRFQEGNWNNALEEVIRDVVTYPAGFIKGPRLRRQLRRKVTLNPATNTYTSSVNPMDVPYYERRPPDRIFPEPDSKGIDDGYLIDLVPYRADQLSSMIDVEGYDSRAIRTVLATYRNGGLKEWLWTNETEQALYENKDSTAINTAETIDCIEFHGSFQGRILRQWGMSEAEVPDMDMEYPVEVWVIGPHVIRATLNPNPEGKKDFYKASFIEDPDAFWGRGIPQTIDDVEEVCNAVGRGIVNNAVFGSGPIVDVNIDRLANNETWSVYPMKTFRTTNKAMKDGKPINFYQPPLVVDKLERTLSYFLELADYMTMIPRYDHAGTQGQPIKETATGISMKMSQSSKGMKMVTKNIDKGIIEPSVTAQYGWELDHGPKSELVGDLIPVAKGSSSLIVKEQMNIRKNEFLASTNNPVDFSLIGPDGRKELLKDAVRGLEMDVDRIWKDEESLNAKAELYRTGAMAAAGGQPVPGEQQPVGPAPSEGAVVNPAGNRPAGQDYALFNRPERPRVNAPLR